MRYTRDTELRGTARVYDDMAEMTDVAVRHGKEHNSPIHSGSWVGREFTVWDDITRAVNEPWADALYEVQQMIEELKSKVKPPDKVTRTKAWSMKRGSGVSVDRYLNGQPEFLRTHTKRPKSGIPTNCTIVCNVGNTADWSFKDIFWRGAAAIAAVDLLEGANYRCEVWVYNLARYVNSDYEVPNSLCACRVKNSGDVVDIDHLVTATSAWFFRNVVFELRKTDPAYGSVKWIRGSSHANLEKWDKYFDIDSGTTPVVMPAPRQREDAIEAAKAIIDKVVTGQKEEV